MSQIPFDRCSREELRSHCAGLYVGSLSEDELRTFYAMCNEGTARRSYEGASGFMGLAKVAFTEVGAA